MTTQHIDSPNEDIAAKVKTMAEILLKVRSQPDLECLLLGLLTPGEIEGITLRWQLLKLLNQKITQREIMKQLGICLGKISRGARIIKYGDPRMKALLEQLQGEDNGSK